MKRLIAALLCLCLMLCGCTAQPEKPHDETKLQIVCTSFPAYDFAREIADDRAELTLLIKPGSEVHSYEPTPKDMIRIQESDLFICNGGESEQWAKTLITPELNTIYMMGCVDTVEESADGIYNAEDGEPELDEHVWTSPLNAIKISEESAMHFVSLIPITPRRIKRTSLPTRRSSWRLTASSGS